MKLLNTLLKPKYLLLAIASAIAMASLYVYSQVLFILENVGVWLANVPALHALLLAIFVALFGITFAYQASLWIEPNACAAKKRLNASGAGGIGTIGIFLIAQCPACASLGALFLPLSAITFIGVYTIPLNMLSIALLAFTLYYLGAFERK